MTSTKTAPHHSFHLNAEARGYECVYCGEPVSTAKPCSGAFAKPPPGSQEWLALQAGTVVIGAAPGVVGVLVDEDTSYTDAIEKEYRKVIADNRRYLVIRDGFAMEHTAVTFRAHHAAEPAIFMTFDQFVQSGNPWIEIWPQGIAKRRENSMIVVLLTTGLPQVKDVEALRAELSAVHSDLGDASQSVFDLFETVREKEAEFTKTIAAHRDTVSRLTDTIEALKTDLARAKAAL